MKIVDSSFLIALYVEEDVQHPKAARIFEETNEELELPFEVLTEMLTVISGLKGINEVNLVFDKIKKNNQFVIREPLSPDSHRQILTFFLSQKQEDRLSYIDCLQVVIAKKENKEIISFDKKIEKAMKH